MAISDASFLFYDISVLIELYRGEISIAMKTDKRDIDFTKDEKEVIITDNFFYSFVSSSLIVFVIRCARSLAGGP